MSAVIEQSVRNVLYAFRQFRRSPGFVAVAVLLVTLGIGASTLLFSVAEALLLRPLPVSHPENLVQLFVRYLTIRPQSYFNFPLYQEINRQSTTLSNVVGQLDITAPFERSGSSERAYIETVTDNFFSSLGVNAAFGRVLDTTDDHVAVLSYDGWLRLFGRDHSVVGQKIRLGGHFFDVIGVTAEGFTGTTKDTSPDIFVSFRHISDFSDDSTFDENRSHLEIIGRLNSGVSLEQARLETETLWRGYRDAPGFVRSNPEAERNTRLELQSLEFGFSVVRDQVRTALLVLFAGTGLFLLIVCSNVSGLLLARAASRDRETAVRLALGATRGQIIQQCFSESLFITCIGAVGAVLLTYAATPLLQKWWPPIPGVGQTAGELRKLSLYIGPGTRVFGFCIGLCLIVTCLSVLAPAWRCYRKDLFDVLRTATAGKRHQRIQTVICTFQIALCSVLLISAMLIGRTLSNLRAVDPGFDRDHIATFTIDPRMRHYTSEQASVLRQRLVEEARSLPGVVAAGIAGRPLIRGIGLVTSLRLPGQEMNGDFNTSLNVVSPGYFDAMRIRLAFGRDFQEGDADRIPVPIVVNETFARRWFGSVQAVGRQVGVTSENKPQYQIVGVVADAHYRSLREVPPPVFYLPFGPKSTANSFVLQVRALRNPESVIQPVRELLKSIDLGMPLYEVGTLAGEIDRSLWQERVLLALAKGFGLFAIILTAVTLYGMLTYFVVLRRREFGIRSALGAGRLDILQLALGHILMPIGAGLVLGGILYTALSRWVQTVLYGVPLFDPYSIAIVVCLIVITSAAATVFPWLRAIRFEPLTALRTE